MPAVGNGSFASIVEGRDTQTGARVALKLIHRNRDGMDPAREAMALRAVGTSHPHVVQCFEL